MKRTLLILAATATAGLGVALARQPGAPSPPAAPAAAPSMRDTAAAFIARAKRCEELGLVDAAISSYTAALSLESANLPAQAALVRLSASPVVAGPRPPDPGAGNSDPGLALDQDRMQRDLDRLVATVSAQDEQIRQLQSTLSDHGRAEPIVDRLDRTIIDLQRQATQNENDIRRIQSDIDRVRSSVDRIRSSPR